MAEREKRGNVFDGVLVAAASRFSLMGGGGSGARFADLNARVFRRTRKKEKPQTDHPCMCGR